MAHKDRCDQIPEYECVHRACLSTQRNNAYGCDSEMNIQTMSISMKLNKQI